MNHTDRKVSIKIASQKLGMEIPNTDTSRLTWSAPLSCLTADKRPSGIPRASENNTPSTASSALTGIALNSSANTGLPL